MKKFKLGQEVVYRTKESDEWQVGRIHKIVVTAILNDDGSIGKAIDCYDCVNKWMYKVWPVKEFIKIYKKDVIAIEDVIAIVNNLNKKSKQK